MSDLVLSDALSFSYPYQSRRVPMNTPIWNSSGSVNQTISHSSHDFMEFTISLKGMSTSDKNTLLEFLWKHNMNEDTFLIKDEWGYGYEVAQQSIGTGDGVEDEFQLIETVGSNDYNRYNIVASSYSVWVNSVLQTEGGGNDYTIDTTDSGIITFNGGSIPALGHDVEAAFDYYRRVLLVSEAPVSFKSYNNNVTSFVLREVNIAA